MKKNLKNGFTLVELLAVIVILAIILVIAVPKVMSVIEDAKKATLESTAKMIASQAEKQKVQNTVLGNNEAITCKDITNINDVDYASCDITFDENTAKVTITGSGKFEGLFVCDGTKTSAEATDESCNDEDNGNDNNVVAVDFETDDWATIVANVKQAKENGEDYPYQVGNTKTVDMGDLGTHTIRVANTTKCSEVTVTSKTACGFVLEFADIIERAEMNDRATSTGGWRASNMRTYVNSTIYNTLPDALKTGIIETYVISSPGSAGTTGYENVVGENFYSTDKLYLLSPQEVYGTSFTSEYDKSNGTSRQLDYYANYQGNGYTGVSTSKYEGAIKQYSGSNSRWWLRSAYSSVSYAFHSVDYGGNNNASDASNSYGLAPAFRLAD